MPRRRPRASAASRRAGKPSQSEGAARGRDRGGAAVSRRRRRRRCLGRHEVRRRHPRTPSSPPSSTTQRESDLRATRAAVRIGWRGVREHRTAAQHPAGMRYGPAMRPEPFESGESDTQRAPTLLTLEARSARETPRGVERQLDLDQEIAPLVVREMERLGARSLELHRASQLSAPPRAPGRIRHRRRFRVPKLPPTSPVTTRRSSGGTPSAPARSRRCRSAPPLGAQSV